MLIWGIELSGTASGSCRTWRRTYTSSFGCFKDCTVCECVHCCCISETLKN